MAVPQNGPIVAQIRRWLPSMLMAFPLAVIPSVATAATYGVTNSDITVDGVVCPYSEEFGRQDQITKPATIGGHTYPAGTVLDVFTFLIQCPGKSENYVSAFVVLSHPGGGVSFLPFLPNTDPEAVAVATAIAYDPFIVGYASTDFGPFHARHAFRYDLQTQQMLDLGTLAPTNAAAVSMARGISKDGSVVVGWSNSDVAFTQAFRWTSATGMQPIGELMPNGSSRALDVSLDGQVIVGDAAIPPVGPFTGIYDAFRWTQSTGMVDLGSFDGPGQATGSVAEATNSDGSVIVGANSFQYEVTPGNSIAGSHAFRWQGGTMADIGILPGTNISAMATDVSANGQVVVGISSDDFIVDPTSEPLYSDASRAFRWTNATGIEDLNELAATAGVDMHGTLLVSALSVSADGTDIAGAAFTPASPNDRTAYVLHYVDPTTGSPLAAAVFRDLSFGASAPTFDTFSEAEARASLDQTSAALGNAVAQEEIVSGALFNRFGSWEPPRTASISGLGAVGSVIGGVRGQLPLPDHFSLSGGMGFGQIEERDVAIGSEVLGAASLRYDFARGTVLDADTKSFIELAGTIGSLANVGITRHYLSGNGAGMGIGQTQGAIASLSLRAGLLRPIGPRDEIGVAAEVGEHWLTLDSYNEVAGSANPFPASYSAGSTTWIGAKVQAQWTHALSDDLDLTLTAGWSHAFAGSGAMSASFTGLGLVAGSPTGGLDWAEVGAQLSYHVTDKADVSLFVAGDIGMGAVETKLHGGVAIDVKF